MKAVALNDAVMILTLQSTDAIGQGATTTFGVDEDIPELEAGMTINVNWEAAEPTLIGIVGQAVVVEVFRP